MTDVPSHTDRAPRPGSTGRDLSASEGGEPGDPPAFEAALAELESLVEALERGELTLEQSVAAFETGQRLLRVLNQRLNEAERRVKVLLVDGAEVVERDLDEGGDRS
jgi:exodeoxyribonuclease VII small subunit